MTEEPGMYDSCPYCGSTERKHDWRACGQEQYDDDRDDS